MAMIGAYVLVFATWFLIVYSSSRSIELAGFCVMIVTAYLHLIAKREDEGE